MSQFYMQMKLNRHPIHHTMHGERAHMYYQKNEVMDPSEEVQSIPRAGSGKVICGENRDILHILK